LVDEKHITLFEIVFLGSKDMKPDRFLLMSDTAPQKAIDALGPGYSDRYIVTAAMSWDHVKDVPCLLFSVFVNGEDEDEPGVAYAQVMYLDDVHWVPAENIYQLRREAVENSLIENVTKEDLTNKA